MSLLARATSHEQHLRSPASSTETFTDANNPSGLLRLAIGSSNGASRPLPDAWAAGLSGTFAMIAWHLQNASRTLAAVPATDQHHLAARLDAIEQAQEQLAEELATLRTLHAGKSGSDELPASADLERRMTEALAAQSPE